MRKFKLKIESIEFNKELKLYIINLLNQTNIMKDPTEIISLLKFVILNFIKDNNIPLICGRGGSHIWISKKNNDRIAIIL